MWSVVVWVSAALAAVAAFVPRAHAWERIHKGLVSDVPECVSWAPGRIDCLARLPTGRLDWIVYDKGRWHAPRDLGGNVVATPSCVVRGPGGLNCFAVSAKGVLAAIALNGAAWGSWISLGGELAPGRVSCVGLGRDRMACFARGRRGQLLMRKWNGGRKWDPWLDLGGELGGDPDCIAAGPAGASCFARAASGELVAHMAGVGGKSDWLSLGGAVEGRPSCLRLRSGEAICVAQSRSGRLQLWRGVPVLGQGTGITSSNDEITTMEPVCAVTGGALTCMLRNARHQIVRRSLGGADTANDGVLDTPPLFGLTCLAHGADAFACVAIDAERRLRFAAGAALLANPASEPALADADASTGMWYLSNLRSGDRCLVRLTSVRTFAAKRLQLEPACRVLGLRVALAQWDQEDGALYFLSPRGRTVLRFDATAAGRWLGRAQGAAFLLTREAPDEVGEAPAVERHGKAAQGGRLVSTR